MATKVLSASVTQEQLEVTTDSRPRIPSPCGKGVRRDNMNTYSVFTQRLFGPKSIVTRWMYYTCLLCAAVVGSWGHKNHLPVFVYESFWLWPKNKQNGCKQAAHW